MKAVNAITLRFLGGPVLTAAVVLGFASPVQSSETDQRTREMLEAIITGYHSNRAKISDFRMSGNIITLHGEGESQKKKEIAFQVSSNTESNSNSDLDIILLARKFKKV